MTVACVLWDFGNTLCDETFCARGPDGVDGWRDAWAVLFDTDVGQGWDLGRASVTDVAAWIGEQIDRDPALVVEDLHRLMRDITFFASSLEAVRRIAVPQAVVTVNPDAFRDVIVPHYGFDDLFDTIVISYEEGTVDKADLCDVALERFGMTGQRDRALLIDNLERNVSAWRARGGLTYHYRGEQQFTADLAREPLSLIPTG